MDLTSKVPANRQYVQSYGGGGFRVSGQRWEGSILVLPGATYSWQPLPIEALTAADFAPVLVAEPKVEVLLLGCGPAMVFVTAALRADLRAHGIVVDTMDTGAACRTYNVLVSEDRRVAAALIAI